MNDPTVVPWEVVWIGLVLAVSGAVLAIRSVVRERFSARGERIGLAVLAIGFVLMVGPLFLAGGALIVKAVVATVSPQPVGYQSPDQ